MYMIVSAIIPPISFINTSNPWLAHSVYLIHPINKILPPIGLLKSPYCFFPPFRVYFHQWLLSLCFWVSVDYATGEPLFPILTIFSITSFGINLTGICCIGACSYREGITKLAVMILYHGIRFSILMGECYGEFTSNIFFKKRGKFFQIGVIKFKNSI